MFVRHLIRYLDEHQTLHKTKCTQETFKLNNDCGTVCSRCKPMRNTLILQTDIRLKYPYAKIGNWKKNPGK